MKEFLKFVEKQGRYELLNAKNWLFLAILTVLIFEPFWQIIDNFETAEKDTMRWFLPTFFFSVSFPHRIKLRRIPWREKVHICPTFWPPKNSQNGQKMRRAKRICFLAVKLLLLQFGMSDLDMEYIKIFVRPIRF